MIQKSINLFKYIIFLINCNKIIIKFIKKEASCEEKKEFDIKYEYKNKIKSLEKENKHLHKIIDKFYNTIEKFIHWICLKFRIGESKELVKNFQEDTHTFIDPVKQLDFEEKQKY